MKSTFTAQSGTLYGRFSFRTNSTTGHVDENNALTFRLKSDADTIAGCFLYWLFTDHYQLIAMDGSTTSSVNMTGTDIFDDATYYMKIIYIPGTSVQCQVTDTSNNVVSNADTTLTTSQNGTVNSLSLATRTALIQYRMDIVELRKNTSWGDP